MRQSGRTPRTAGRHLVRTWNVGCESLCGNRYSFQVLAWLFPGSNSTRPDHAALRATFRLARKAHVAMACGAVPNKERCQAASASVSEPKGQEFVYSARIPLDRTQIEVDDANANLSPGMAVTVEIRTGSQERPPANRCASPSVRPASCARAQGERRIHRAAMPRPSSRSASGGR